MAIELTKAHTIMNALADALAARAGLDSVQVATAPLGKDTAREAIVLADGRASQEWGSIGAKSRDEELTIAGLVWVTRPGAGETVIRETRARAFALLAEIETHLREDPTALGSLKWYEFTSYTLDQGANDLGRWVQIDFEIVAKGRLSSI